jgi:hypothetical protein
MSQQMATGHLYIQTNEARNALIHYHRSANGALTEVERVATDGGGSGTFKPISGQESSPNAFEGAGSVILSPDRRFLFTTMAATIRFPASVSETTAGSRSSTSNRPGTPSKEGAVPPNRWPMPPQRACFSCCTHSAPDHLRLMSGSCPSTPKASSRRARSGTPRIRRTRPTVCRPWDQNLRTAIHCHPVTCAPDGVPCRLLIDPIP